jgi:hypothetical protein
VKKQGWMGGGTRSVKFTHATTAAPMVKFIFGCFNQKKIFSFISESD